MREITTYTEFWPYYLREHRHPATRGWHYVGTGLALLTLALIILSGKWLFLPLAFICGYFFAWVSHGLIEAARPLPRPLREDRQERELRRLYPGRRDSQ